METNYIIQRIYFLDLTMQIVLIVLISMIPTCVPGVLIAITLLSQSYAMNALISLSVLIVITLNIALIYQIHPTVLTAFQAIIYLDALIYKISISHFAYLIDS